MVGVWRLELSHRGRQVTLSLLALLVSHLVLMATPAHAGVVAGAESHAAAHASGEGRVGPAGHDAHARGDCAIQGTAPARPTLDIPIASTSPDRMDCPTLDALLPAPPERWTWSPPLLDLQVRFQVFRI